MEVSAEDWSAETGLAEHSALKDNKGVDVEFVKLLDDYFYLPDYNLIINRTFEGIFRKYCEGKKNATRAIRLNERDVHNNISNVGQITFEVTQNCNLRCQYCPYTGGFNFERERSKLFMSVDTAKQSIDYFAEIFKYRFKDDLSIAFYGGEPLLNFDTIKFIVVYARRVLSHLNLKFSITTNGTLGSDAIIEFLISQNFTVTVSLDGPQENHDAKRVFPDNSGSFASVWIFISKIYNINPEYFSKKVNFSAVYSYDLPIKNVFDFFINNDRVNSNVVRFGSAKILHSDYKKRFPDIHESFNKEYNDVLKSILSKKDKNTPLKPIEKEFCMSVQNELRATEFSALAGACDFSSKIFVDCSGKLHICEKMNDKFSIGDVVSGLRIKKIREILNGYYEVLKENCYKCSFRFLCNPCYVNFAADGTFKLDEQICKDKIVDIKKNLKKYIKLNLPSRKNHSIAQPKFIKKFHQFILTEKGPQGTAVMDFLKGEIYHISNDIMDDFNEGKHGRLGEFIKDAIMEELIIEVPQDVWIPTRSHNKLNLEFAKKLSGGRSINLEIEEGADLKLIHEKVNGLNLLNITFYGRKNPSVEKLFEKNVVFIKKDFSQCIERSTVNGGFDNCTEVMYSVNKHCNSCWGYKVAVSSAGDVLPCIHSKISVGNIKYDDIRALLARLKEYWFITKDKVKKCRDCEFRYICFDCREIAFRNTNDIYAHNPNCHYDPYTFSWQEV